MNCIPQIRTYNNIYKQSIPGKGQKQLLHYQMMEIAITTAAEVSVLGEKKVGDIARPQGMGLGNVPCY
jgi:hypothetical protein